MADRVVRYADDPTSAVDDYDALGVLALLTEVPPTRLKQSPDVLALNELEATETGPADISTLEAFCRKGTLRSAAEITVRASQHRCRSTGTRRSRAGLEAGRSRGPVQGTVGTVGTAAGVCGGLALPGMPAKTVAPA